MEYLINSLASDVESCRLTRPIFPIETRPKEIWKHKVFCILSSQFSSQKAAKISDHIVREIPFFEGQIRFGQLEEACYHFLNDRRVGHRFPRIRARQIAWCWFPFAQISGEYHQYVSSFVSEEQARVEIVNIFPGIGFKQASMFLRNIGASRNLSIIDTHILFYLQICHGWAEALTPKSYLKAEDILRKDALRYNLELNTFDTIIWSTAKAVKRASAHV